MNVKFPCDFSQAPYTVVACGTDLVPQKVTFPFSLVAPRQESLPEVPPAYNQISPAWMLRENIYALKRCEAKFRARNRARRSRFDFAVFRPDTVRLMLASAQMLEDVPAVRPLYTDRNIPGLGKNVLTESDRVRAVEAYRFYARYWALLGLLDRLQAAGRAALEDDGDDATWSLQRRTLADTDLLDDAGGALDMLVGMAEKVATDVERSRQRDDARGVRIIPDYAEVHPAVADDPVVRAARYETDAVQQIVGPVRPHRSPVDWNYTVVACH